MNAADVKDWQDRLIYSDYLEEAGQSEEAAAQRCEALVEQTIEHIVYGRCDRFLPVIKTALDTRNSRLSSEYNSAAIARNVASMTVGRLVRSYSIPSLAQLRRREAYIATIIAIERPGVLRLRVEYNRRGSDHVCEVVISALECY